MTRHHIFDFPSKSRFSSKEILIWVTCTTTDVMSKTGFRDSQRSEDIAEI